MLLYRLAWVILRVILPILGRWKVIGHENVPKTGGVIVTPNHVSYADPPVIGAALARQVHFMAKEELFRVPVLGLLIRVVGSFPVKQKTADRAALRRANELLEQDKVLCVFPEGTRSPDGELQKAELGIGMIAVRSGAPIIPIALVGTDRLLPPHSVFPRFSKVEVRIGRPVEINDLCAAGIERKSLQQVGERVMAAIAELGASRPPQR